MKSFLLFILLCIGGWVSAQTSTTPPTLVSQFGVLDNASYLSVTNAAATYAPIDSIQIYTSGATVTVNNKVTWLIINPASVVASLVITMPSSPYDKQMVRISFGGTILPGKPVVTSITISANSGQGLFQPFALDQVLAGETLSYKEVLSLSNWYKQ